MGFNKPPIAVRIIGWAYILTGVVGVAHFGELNSHNPRNDAVWVEPVSLIAIASGAHLLRAIIGRAGWRSDGSASTSC